jgi:hypothetical protein
MSCCWLAPFLLACLPADPPDGVRRQAKSSLRSSAGPRLGSSKSTPGRLPAALRAAAVGAGSATPTGSAESRSAEGTAALPGADPLLKTAFRDDFSRASLGPAYRTSSKAWRIENGRLCVQGARNHPAWLTARLPTNARIEFDAEAKSADGDIKVEAWGDGRSNPTTVSYTNATSYLFILGGWKNTLHVLARLDEHGENRAELRVDPDSEDPRTAPVWPERVYHFVIERRDGRTVRFSVDDVEILTLSDQAPLKGAGHEHFAFNDWETSVCFDNLDIFPLGG